MVKDLTYIVHMALLDEENYNARNFERYLQWAIFCCTTEIHLKYFEKLKVEYITMSDIKTANLPADYLSYTKIGFCYRGQIINLGLNNELCLPRGKDECGTVEEIVRDVDCSSSTLDYGYGRYGYVGHFRNGQYVGELYGLGGGFAESYYRIDKAKQQIVFSSDVPGGEVILEYKSSGIEADGSMLVDLRTFAAIRAYIHWQKDEHNKAVPAGEKERLRNLFTLELDKLGDIQASFTAQEYLDMHYKASRTGPKR